MSSHAPRMSEPGVPATAHTEHIPHAANVASSHRSKLGLPGRPNLSANEQLVSTVTGAALLAAGLARGRTGGLLAGLAGAALLYRGSTGHCMAYEALGIDRSDTPRYPRPGVEAKRGAKVETTLAIHRKPEELFAFWRDVENLPKVMHHLRRVDAIDQKRSRWEADGPLGKTVTWEAEIFHETEPESIAWRSVPGSEIDTAGSIHFRALGGDRGTEVRVSMKYDPPAGIYGATIASWMGADLEQMMHSDLKRFQALMETGEVPTTSGQPTGR